MALTTDKSTAMTGRSLGSALAARTTHYGIFLTCKTERYTSTHV
jgi:hypothetical protein